MASIAEGSIASVPADVVERLRENMLQQPEADNDMHASGADDNTDNSKQATIPESVDVCDHAYSTPKAPGKTSPPRLSTSRSAPVEKIEAMIQQTPSQEAFREFTRASSIPAANNAYPGGDTQEFSSQVYHDFRASMAVAKTTPKKTLIRHVTSPNGETVYEEETVRTEMDGDTVEWAPHTLEEGEPGYVDLVKHLQDTSPTARSESSHVRELLESARTQRVGLGGVEVPTMPETPNVAGRKHSRDGELLNSVITTNKKTPGFSQWFGGGEKGALLTATQAFNQTQAPSSPMVDGPRSDPVATRPSPNLPNHYTVSSPSMPHSSPVTTRDGMYSSMSYDPRTKYMSIKESQEHRAAKFRLETGVAERFGEELWDDDFDNDTQQRKCEEKRLRRLRNESVMNEAGNIRAPSRPGSRPTSSGKHSDPFDLVTPAPEKTRNATVDDHDIEDGNDTDDDVILEAEGRIEHEEGDGGDDYYDELAQAVCRSQGPAEDDDHDGSALSAAGDDMEGVEQEPVDAQEQDQPEQHQEDVGDQSRLQGHIPTRPSAIADSQSFQPAKPQTHEQGGGGPLLSFVPGSQYVGSTRVEQAIASSRGNGIDQHVRSTHKDKIPSSPPLLAIDGAMDDVEPPRASSRYEAGHLVNTSPPNVALEVPESDIAKSDGIEQRPPSRSANDSGESNSNQLFSTARSHVSRTCPSKHSSGPGVSPLEVSESQNSKSLSPTPRTAAGVRHFADITGATNTPKASGENDIDIEAIASDVVTAEDEQLFQMLEASPTSDRAQKRRKTTHLSDAINTSSPTKDARSKVAQRTRLAHAKQEVFNTSFEALAEPTADILQNNLNKANELRAATPVQEDALESTPESVKLREDAGAKAASQLLSRRSSRALKPSALRAMKQVKSTASARKKRVELAVQPEDAEPDQSVHVRETGIEQIVGTDGGVADSTARHDTDQRSIAEDSRLAISLRYASNRVLALFKGSFNNFYPATWLGNSPDGKKYCVRFEDGNVTSIDTKHVRNFDLRIGDVVKVDLPEMRGKSWIVMQIGQVAETEEDVAGGIDANGHTTVHVQAKGSRASGAAAAVVNEKAGRVVEVPTSSVYLTHTIWPHFAERIFSPPGTASIDPSRPGTPSTGLRTPNADTPASRSKRAAVPTAKALASRPSNLREEPEVPSSPSSASGLFSGMAFAISYGSNENEKANVTQLIVRNGGIILEHGFDELFALPNLDECAVTNPSKTTEYDNSRLETENTSLQLKPNFERLGFVALIADKHSRRAKYVQALALGLPTLSGRWIADSLDSSRNASITTSDASPLCWSKYLLPAGESSYLNGAVHSRTMSVYPAAAAKLSTTIQNRDILLNGEGVLIVAPKKGKATWERRKAYAFLTLALGAGGVKRVADLAEAKAYVAGKESRSRWVYVDGSVGEASRVLFGSGKRKRDEDGEGDRKVEMMKVDAKAMVARSGDGRVGVVNDEFVVQSLILGALID